MLWLKALHIIAVICWFVGIFYLPRLFVYHAMAEDQATRDHFKIMERKLYRFVTPFMLFTVIFGLAMVMLNLDYYLQQSWLWLKLVLVLPLLGYHFYCGHLVNVFANDDNARSHIFYRWFNEAPVLLLFAIVFLVVLKPF